MAGRLIRGPGHCRFRFSKRYSPKPSTMTMARKTQAPTQKLLVRYTTTAPGTAPHSDNNQSRACWLIDRFCGGRSAGAPFGYRAGVVAGRPGDDRFFATGPY